MNKTKYRLCKHCDHFVDENTGIEPRNIHKVTKYIHLEDGEQEFDHDAEPQEKDGERLSYWRANRPELFLAHPDGKIGPNSIHHNNQRGKEK